MSENSDRLQDMSVETPPHKENNVPGRRKFLQFAAGSSALSVLAGAVGAGTLGFTSAPAEAARSGNPLTLYGVSLDIENYCTLRWFFYTSELW